MRIVTPLPDPSRRLSQPTPGHLTRVSLDDGTLLHYTKVEISISQNSPIRATVEMVPSHVEIDAIGIMTTHIGGKRYKLVCIEEDEDPHGT